jgi:murein DD-endopeptidase MepM/ murein hydrolase activator NlpD
MARFASQRSGRKGNKAKTAVRFGIAGLMDRMFCKRSIIIVSDHKTQHVPVSVATQFLVGAAALGFVVWGSFSSGSYMAAQRVIDEKEQKLASFEHENAKVEAEFTLLKQDLMKLAEGGKGAKTAEAAKEIVEQFTPDTTKSSTVAASEAESQYNVVFNRIQFLENKVKDLQSNHDAMIAGIRATTGGKIKEIENVIARTGVNPQPLQRAAEAKQIQIEQRREKYGRTEAVDSKIEGGQGGPYMPLPASVLKEKDTELYFNLRKLVMLNDVVESMPLGSPMSTSNYKRTSGYGTRVDPFRGTLSFHAGIDLAGPAGAKILAANDGRVEFAGWKTAYGNVVDVKHEYGFVTRYGHLKQILVRNGQFVKKGQAIAVQGSTGRSTGDHLHYEVRYNNQPINPANFMKAGYDAKALN